MLTANNLDTINNILKKGSDVRIQKTKDGFRILEDRVRVVSQVVLKTEEYSPARFPIKKV